MSKLGYVLNACGTCPICLHRPNSVYITPKGVKYLCCHGYACDWAWCACDLKVWIEQKCRIRPSCLKHLRRKAFFVAARHPRAAWRRCTVILEGFVQTNYDVLAGSHDIVTWYTQQSGYFTIAVTKQLCFSHRGFFRGMKIEMVSQLNSLASPCGQMLCKVPI